MAEVSIAPWAMVLRRFEEQRHQLVALPCVFEGAQMCGFDLDAVVLAVDTSGSLGGSGIDLDALISIDPFDLQVRYAYDVSCVGHRCYLH